jgi:hypothetical protein
VVVGSRREVEFGEDAVDVFGDRSVGHDKAAGDGGVGAAFGDEGEDLAFTGEGVGAVLGRVGS